MAAIDNLVNVTISQLTSAISQPSFSIPAVFGPSNRFASITTTTANTVTGSAVITSLSANTNVYPGASISGAGIPVGSYILSATGTSCVISQNCTATASSVSLTLTDSIRGYSSLASMTTDGFQPTDPEFIRVGLMLEQALTPTIIYVGKYSASVAQIDTLLVNTASSSHVFSGTINGQSWSYTATGSSTSTAAAGIEAAINALSNPVVTATVSTAQVSITSNTVGVPFVDVCSDADVTLTSPSVANHTITTDIGQARLQNDTWYGLAICSNLTPDITQVAAYIEPATPKKIFMAVSSDANIPTSSASDLASVLKGLSYKRTALVYTSTPSDGIEGAWLGGVLPTVPGSSNWAFKTLVGISADVLSSSQLLYIYGNPEAGTFGKNCNCYSQVGGQNITQMGQMVGSQYIDITVGIDWLVATIQTNIYSQLVQLPKIPYTDVGMTVVMQQVKAAIDLGVLNGLIDGSSPITISAPAVLSVPSSQRANRIAPTITFSCRLQGALNAVIVQGVVTV